MDDASSVFDASILTGPVANYPVADSFNRALERDYSTGDIPHVFVGIAVWNLPLERQRTRSRAAGRRAAQRLDVAAIVTLQSGIPVAVTQATNFNAFAGFGTQRPNLVGDPELPASSARTHAGSTPSAFAIAPQFTLGGARAIRSAGRATRNIDLAIARRFALPNAMTGGHRTSLELRVEAFNLTNTPPLGAPVTVAGNPGFGAITSAGDPRVLQLAAKVAF